MQKICCERKFWWQLSCRPRWLSRSCTGLGLAMPAESTCKDFRLQSFRVIVLHFFMHLVPYRALPTAVVSDRLPVHDSLCFPILRWLWTQPAGQRLLLWHFCSSLGCWRWARRLWSGLWSTLSSRTRGQVDLASVFFHLTWLLLHVFAASLCTFCLNLFGASGYSVHLCLRLAGCLDLQCLDLPWRDTCTALLSQEAVAR